VSFVPLQGQARFHPADPPREGEIEFTGPQRALRLPMRGAIPVLTRALRAGDAHASVTLLSSATMLAMKLVAAGRLQRSPAGHAWQVGPMRAEDDERVRALATARAYAGLEADEAEEIIRALLDAVADTMTRQTAQGVGFSTGSTTGERRTLAERLEQRGADDDLPGEVSVSLRIEAPDEQLAGGHLTVVPQVHELDVATHVVDAEQLWLDQESAGGHGFSRRARVSAGVALRRAAQAWPVLDRLLGRSVPDRLILEDDEVADLLDHGLPALAGIGVDVFWPRGLRQELVPQARVEVRSRNEQSAPLMTGVFGPDALFEFDWRLALAGDPLTDQEMTALAEANGPVIRLRDNWMVIDPETARRARAAVGRRSRRELKPVDALKAVLTGTIADPFVHGDEATVEVHPGATLEKVRDRIVDAAQVSPLDPPPGLRATLRDYQRHGLTWLAELTGAGLGACLADDMGLGKTVTLIGLHLHRRDRRLSSGPTLVVCPASLLGNWEAEVRRFAPGVPTRRFHGAQRDLAGLGDGFVFTTYGTMRADHETLATVDWDLVVADEAQHIKNATSSTARNLRLVPSRCRVALTGTPVENNLTELWAILDWATPGLLGSRNAFRKVWAAPIESGVDPAVARQFAQLVEPFLLRRRKSDPGIAPELPPKTETDQVVSLTQEQVVLYESLVRESMRRIEEADVDSRRGLVLALLTGLKQICNHPAHYLRQANGRIPGRSEKIDLLDELLGTILAEGGSALVFTQYVAMARLLERHLDTAGVPTLFLHGGTPVRSREEMVATFQAGGVPVFLLSLKAGGTGLNLTRADHVIHVDRWWNPAVEDQATDRAHRIGQTRAVQVHRLVTEGTIEQKIGELLARKRSLADAVLGAGETALTELSDDELRDLVTLRTRDD